MMRYSVNAIEVFDLITEMFNDGFDLNCGPHGPYRKGFYAAFYKDETGAGLMPQFQWHEAGHGLTLLDSLKQARELAHGRPVVTPDVEMFNP